MHTMITVQNRTLNVNRQRNHNARDCIVTLLSHEVDLATRERSVREHPSAPRLSQLNVQSDRSHNGVDQVTGGYCVYKQT